ncbi:hypothetical protein C8R45DRAFT_974191 [Mycena sanguinolenta]|nr:hypothetical protein C8R45DRAFT_974191 [Mycena sanguinolenta]
MSLRAVPSGLVVIRSSSVGEAMPRSHGARPRTHIARLPRRRALRRISSSLFPPVHARPRPSTSSSSCRSHASPTSSSVVRASCLGRGYSHSGSGRGTVWQSANVGGCVGEWHGMSGQVGHSEWNGTGRRHRCAAQARSGTLRTLAPQTAST